MYLIDANALIEASRHYYSFSLAPPFWKWLVEQAESGNISSIRAVRGEIRAGDDELSVWATEDMPARFWVPEDEKSAAAMEKLAVWVVRKENNFTPQAIDAFMASADMQLLACAMATKSTIMTREVSSPGARRRVKIPDEDMAMGVRCRQPFEVYEELGLLFS